MINDPNKTPPIGPDSPTWGLECPGCGCKHFEVLNTKHLPSRIYRYRRCRNCGRRVTTSEKINPPKQKK